jgi:dTDP-glucose 4,6-dehydratase
MANGTILITGGAGFIGSHLVERLVAAGHRVVNLDLLTYAGNPDNLAAVENDERHVFVRGDIGDRALVRSLLETHRPQVVFNLAAESHVDRSIDQADPFIDTNVAGVYRLLDATLAFWRGLEDESRQRFRYIQMSTDEVYGSIASGMFTEESKYTPNSPYAASKAAGDHLTRSFGVTYGLPVSIVHASNTYGPRQYPEKLIPHMIISALAGKPLPVYGEGTNVRDWLHVGDLVRGLEHVVAQAQPGEVYNFAGGEEWKNIDTVRAICAHLDRCAPAASPHAERISYVTDRPGHDQRYAMASDKVLRLFGWRPEACFADGLASTVSWYVDNRAWWQNVLRRGYAAVRIGIGATPMTPVR